MRAQPERAAPGDVWDGVELLFYAAPGAALR